MNKDQHLGLLRAALLAFGAGLATFGVCDNIQWQAILGCIMALISMGWGLWWHRDPNTPGMLKWSLVRKLVNGLGSVAAVYGYKHPEKIAAITQFVAAIGPLLAAYFSWISNAPEDEEKEDDGMNVPLIAIGFLFFFLLPSCGVPLKLVSPYGTYTQDAKGGMSAQTEALDLTRDADGTLTVIPKVKTLTIDGDK